MKRKLRYGMIGGGPGAFIGGVHRAAIRLNDNAELVCGCFSNIPEERVQAGEEFGIAGERNYETFEEMAEKEGAREERIDWVDIVTPNRFHYPAIKLFLTKGINVVCEKPLCFTVEEGRELQELARRNGCLFAIPYTYTGHAMVREARQLIRDNVIGDIRMVIAEYPQDWIIDSIEAEDDDPKAWRSDPSMSGRGAAVADLGTHIENWVHYVTGLKIESVCCHLDSFGRKQGLDNNVECLVKFRGGATGMYWTSQVAIGFDNALKIRVFGSKGTIEFVQEESDYLKLYLRDEPPRILSRGNKYISAQASGYQRLPAGHPEGLIEAFANIYADFTRAIYDKMEDSDVSLRQSEYGYPTIEMGIAGVEFFNKCVGSHEGGGIWIQVE